VAIVVSDGSNPFEMSVAAEIFGLRRPELGFQPYEIIVCGPKRSLKMRDAMFSLRLDHSLSDALDADTIIVPNRPDPLAGQPAAVLAMVRNAARLERRLIGFCTGAFTLAQAGVLKDERNVTMHWRWTEEFARRYPSVNVVPDVLYVEDGNVLTSAGSSSAIDLCLHLVRTDFGAAVAASVSRRLVYPLHRAGGQQQFTELPVTTSDGDAIGNLMDAVRQRLQESHSVESMASVVSLAPSTFHRHFLARAGLPPLLWLQRERVDYARQLLESSNATVDVVAGLCGLGTATNLRTHFRRHVGTTPTAYRAMHQAH
jgi:AraC family transcriptional regulator, transcriptional activator FtrA